MTKSLKNDYPYNVLIKSPSIADVLAYNGFISNNQGIDTIELIAKYTTVKNMIEKMNLSIKTLPQEHKSYKKYQDQREKETKKRLLDNEFPIIIERVRLPKVQGRDKDFYITIIRNIPTLFDVASHHKKAKNTYCLVVFAGLHQPTKRINSQAIQIISKFLKRKAFKLHRLDIAIDTTNHQNINYKQKGAFGDNLMPYGKQGVISRGSSLYINDTKHHSISKIIYYDKFKKQRYQQGKEIITDDLNGWKRLEITLTFDVTKNYNRGFIFYIESLNFINDLYDIKEIAQKVGIKEYKSDYLTYQLNSIIDNRFINNHKSQKQFNSIESLERFRQLEFRRYILPI